MVDLRDLVALMIRTSVPSNICSSLRSVRQCLGGTQARQIWIQRLGCSFLFLVGMASNLASTERSVLLVAMASNLLAMAST